MDPGKRLQARKIRIEKSFKSIKGPSSMMALQQNQSEARLTSYGQLESAFKAFETSMDHIFKKHVYNFNILHQMSSSIMKCSKGITKEVENIKQQMDTFVQDVEQESYKLQKSSEEIGKDIANELQMELHQLKTSCSDIQEEETIASVKALGVVLKYL